MFQGKQMGNQDVDMHGDEDEAAEVILPGRQQLNNQPDDIQM